MSSSSRPLHSAMTTRQPSRPWWRLAAACLGAPLALLFVLGFWPVAPDQPRAPAASRLGPPADAPSAPLQLPAPRTIPVAPGGKIQAALDSAGPGDTIVVPPGTYNESLTIRAYGITLRGERGDAWPVLEGQGTLASGVLAIGGAVTIEQLVVRNYTEHGVLVQAADGVALRDLRAENSGLYGLRVVEAANVLIERCEVSGARAAAISAAHSRAVAIRDCAAHDSGAGVLLESSADALVASSWIYDNAAGVLALLLPGGASKESRNTIVRDNRIERNSRTGGQLPSPALVGYGVLLLASDDGEVTGNLLKDNPRAGVAALGLARVLPASGALDVGVAPERNHVHDNSYIGNGAGGSGTDLLWDGSGAGNRWDDPAHSRSPMLLPSSAWPWPLSRAYMRLAGLWLMG